MRDFDAVEAALSDVLAAVAGRGCDTTISPVIKTPQEAAAGSLLFLDMIDDLRLLHDREGRSELVHCTVLHRARD